MHKNIVQGSCLCGAVRYEAGPDFRAMVHCHCLRCRKGSGTAHSTNLVVEPGSFCWLSGTELVSRFDLPVAKSFGKWFCLQCGSPVPRPFRGGTLVMIPAGSLDVEPPIKPTDHIFWSSRPGWGCQSGDLQTHEEYPASWGQAPA